MSQWLADETLAHLRDVADWPHLGPRYELKGRLGRGGMGAVYLAHDRTLDREVAVKVLDSLPDHADRLLKEAHVLARLEHPGIVPVHDAGTLPDGRVYYVMKRVRGARLGDMADAVASLGERLELFLRVCDAVAFAHAHGVLHGDLKPENIMVGSFGEVLVMDWGAAILLADQQPVISAVAGTPGFMPPEQRVGRAEDLDVRADVYALGALLDAIAPKPVDRRLAAIAARARAERRADRYPTVDALARDVTRLRDREPVEAYVETIAERLARVYQRYRLPILLVLAYMIMRVALLLLMRA